MIYIELFHSDSKAYQDVARKFANMVQAHAENLKNDICLCENCKIIFHQHFDIMYRHLSMHGMDHRYTTWVFYGETTRGSSVPQDMENLETYSMYRDACFQNDNIIEP